MKLRVIEVQTKGLNANDREKFITHYIPQYFDEGRGWNECHLSTNLCACYYYKQEAAIEVCMEYAKKYEQKVVWYGDTDKKRE
jgi:hypothetical protein